MTVLNDANKIYLGAVAADAVYAGVTKVWPKPSGPYSSLLVSYTPGGDRNDFTGEVGVRLGIGTSDITVSWIGARSQGIGGTRTVRLYEWYADSLKATATIDYTGIASGQYAWTAIPPVTLLANGYYALLMAVTASDGKTWQNPGATTFVPSIVNVYGCYRAPSAGLTPTQINEQFVGLDLGQDKPPFTPTNISGLNVWLDASQLALADGAAVSPWPDLSGQANDGIITGAPAPAPKLRTNALNGKPVVRFTFSEGRVRGDTDLSLSGLPAPGYNFSVFYVARMIGPNVGRIFAATYPPPNFLIGYHTSAYASCYDNGWVNVGVGWPAMPTPWVMWGYTASHDGTNYAATFYINGVASGTTTASGGGLQSRYNLSGYDATGIQETCDCEVAELLIYNHKLSDAERLQVEDYLRTKWGL